ncbi:MAG: KPN_02809 family neutral zinc metallopeptidase [Phycisphaerales bacterium]
MRWKGRRESGNVQDRRSMGGAQMAFGGGGIVVVIIAIVVYFMGGNPLTVLQNLPGGGTSGGGTQQELSPEDIELGKMVSVVLAQTEDAWNEIFQEEFRRDYTEPELILFRGQVRSACGTANAAVGPFYCPADGMVYIDLSFYEDLANRFGAPGDFAQAYVIAHEVGHHVQNLLGLTDQVHQQRGKISETEYNKLSVRLELQADFLAGVWAHHANKEGDFIEPGDIEEAMRAAAAIGDDRLQKQTQGYVVPDSFTHGTSEQRMRWFMLGYRTGDMSQGDTFSARDL